MSSCVRTASTPRMSTACAASSTRARRSATIFVRSSESSSPSAAPLKVRSAGAAALATATAGPATAAADGGAGAAAGAAPPPPPPPPGGLGCSIAKRCTLLALSLTLSRPPEMPSAARQRLSGERTACRNPPSRESTCSRQPLYSETKRRCPETPTPTGWVNCDGPRPWRPMVRSSLPTGAVVGSRWLVVGGR